MARRISLGGPTLTPFGGSGSSFGAFSIGSQQNAAYIAFLKIETNWQNGRASDDDYKAALQAYVNALQVGTSARINAEQRLVETTYRLNRNLLVTQIQNGTKTYADLLAFDGNALDGLDQGGQTYRDRLDLYRSTQAKIFNDAEDSVLAAYQDGRMTSAQLQSWYAAQRSGALVDNNPDLAKQLDKRIADLADRVVAERDTQMVNDFNAGKVSGSDFLSYAAAARARYAEGTTEAKSWDQRISDAQKQVVETALLYRYGLSQRYAQLAEFVASNSGKAPGGASTSTSTRVMLGSDGQWHTVTSTSSRATAPSAAEQKAYHDLQVQLADAKTQMAELQGEMKGAPDGGAWVTTQQMIDYYAGRQAELVKGSADWYSLQEKIDSLHDRLHAEQVLSGQGIKITFPGANGGGGGGSYAGSSYSGGGGRGGGSGSPSAGSAFATSPSQQAGGPLSVITGISAPAVRSGLQTYKTTGSTFPTNMDPSAFEKLYSQYVKAFQSGAESFVDLSTGQPIAYFIGQNLDDRIAKMRQLDDLRINLYGTQANAYAGTSREITAAGKYGDAVKAAAGHEYLILDTLARVRPVASANESTTTAPRQAAPDVAANPLAAGIRALDKLTEGIKTEYDLAKAAWERGDVNAAYAHMQNAAHMTDVSTFGPKAGALAGQQAGLVVSIGQYAAAAQQGIANIEQAFGVGIEEALGADAAKRINADLSRLTNVGDEVAALLGKGSEFDKLGQEISTVVKTTPGGVALRDATGSIVLKDGYARFVDPSGTVTVERVPVTDPGMPASGRAPKGYVQTVVRVGSTVETAYAKYQVGTVGYIKNPNGGQNVPLMGKFIVVNQGGKQTTLMENPLDPGHWSSAPIVFNSPTAFSTFVDPKTGTVVPQFQLTTTAGGRGGLQQQTDGTVYSMIFDPASGTYVIRANRPSGLFQAEIKDQPVAPGDLAALLAKAGLTRDTTGLGPNDFANTTMPVIGMTPDEWQKTGNARFVAPPTTTRPRSGLLESDTLAPVGPRIRSADAFATAPAGRGGTGTWGPGAARDTWYRDSVAAATSLPMVTPMTGTAGNPGKQADDLASLPAVTPIPAIVQQPTPLPVIAPPPQVRKEAYTPPPAPTVSSTSIAPAPKPVYTQVGTQSIPTVKLKTLETV